MLPGIGAIPLPSAYGVVLVVHAARASAHAIMTIAFFMAVSMAMFRKMRLQQFGNKEVPCAESGT